MLSFRTKLGYGMGHVLNDLCSAMWFSYLLLYFQQVLSFPNTLAGLVLLIGQVADAVATPFVGYEADRVDDMPLCVKYGRRKTWHLVGTICVSFTFAFIFLGCLGCGKSDHWAQLFYFAPFVVIFQFGWAATQISHLAILPSLSSDPHDRTELNAIRYAFSVLSTITVYCITWLVIGLNSSSPEETMGPQDRSQFVSIVLIVLVIGIIFSIGFHMLTKEDNSPRQFLSIEDEDAGSACFSPMTWKDWFREPQFFQVALMYMATRLFCNLTQVYIPLYLEDTLILDEQSIAYIPLVMYVSGFITATAMRPVNRLAGRKVTYIMGSLLGFGGSIWVLYGSSLMYRQYYLYIVAVLLGSGASTMLVTSLSITADLIGNNVESGAFVYGMMSFTDKLSNGLFVMLIQYLTPGFVECQECLNFFRYVIAYACGGAALLGMFSILTLIPAKIGKRRTKGNSTDEILNRDCSAVDADAGISGYSTVSQTEDEDVRHLINRSGSSETIMTFA